MRHSVRLCLCAILFAGGCAVRSSRPVVTPKVFELTDDELQFADALAYYSVALLREAEFGPFAVKALEAYREAMVRDPDRRRLRAAVVLILTQHNKIDDAISVLISYADDNRDLPEAQLDVAIASVISDRNTTAIDYYQRAIVLVPADTELVIDCARLMLREKRDQEAVDLLASAWKNVDDPRAIKAFLGASSLHFIREETFERALHGFDALRRIEDDPNRRSTFDQLLGDVYLALADTSNARRAFRRSIDSNATNVTAVASLALLESRDRPAKGERILTKAIQKTPSELRYYITLAAIRENNGDTPGALKALETAHVVLPSLRTSPLPPRLFLTHGALLDAAGRKEDSLAMLREGVELHPDDDRLLNFLSYTLAISGQDLDLAETYVKRALVKDPANGAYLDTLGWVYYKQGRFKKALQQLLLAAMAIKEDSEILGHVGETLLALGRTEDALTYWQRALKADPSRDDLRQRIAEHSPK